MSLALSLATRGHINIETKRLVLSVAPQNISSEVTPLARSTDSSVPPTSSPSPVPMAPSISGSSGGADKPAEPSARHVADIRPTIKGTR